ncbi:MAG: sulfatase [Bryobacteraceae bacterium]
MKHAISRRAFARAAVSTAIGAAAPALTGQNRRPNILFMIADDWGHQHAGAYGCSWVRTPNFDRVAREGVLFTNCFTSNPKCSPSRATILTGRNSWQLKEAVNHFSIFPNDFSIYPKVLEQAGYFTGYTGKGWGPGDFKSTGFDHNPAGPTFEKFTLKPPVTGASNKDYARNFDYFLEQKPANSPFCFWLGTHEPHRVYEEGSGIRAGRKPADVTVPAYFPDNRIVRSDLLDYGQEVEWVDQHLGRVLAKLEQTGELDNTLIVVTSDHGMPFPRVKGQIYENGFHIPLAVRWGRNIPAGRKVDDFISTRDFAPTFLQAAGVKAPETITGRSFLDVLRANKSGIVDATRDTMVIGKERHDLGRPGDAGYPVRAIRTRTHLYVRNYAPYTWPAGNPETGYRNVDGSPTKEFILSSFDKYYKMSFGKRPAEELYALETDPECVNNVAASADQAQIKRTLRDRMEKILRDEGDPRMNGNAAFFDTIDYTGARKHSWAEWERNRQ